MTILKHVAVVGKPGTLALALGVLLSGCVQTTQATVDSDPAPATARTGAPTTGTGPTEVLTQRFPAVPVARLEQLVSHTYCATTITSYARTAAETATHRGYAIQVCNPDNEKEGVVVAWVARRGNDIIVTRPDGRPFPRRADTYNIGSQNAQLSIFGMPLRVGPRGCALPRANRFTDPFAVAFCQDPTE